MSDQRLGLVLVWGESGTWGTTFQKTLALLPHPILVLIGTNHFSFKVTKIFQELYPKPCEFRGFPDRNTGIGGAHGVCHTPSSSSVSWGLCVGMLSSAG